MDDLISREYVKKRMVFEPDYEVVLMAPKVDAVPVRHARWEVVNKNKIRCTYCHEEWCIRDDGEFVIIEAVSDLQWCPSCGAKMDGNEAEHEAD